MTTKCRTLLAKTRIFTKLLCNNTPPKIDTVAALLRDTIDANIYITDTTGKIKVISLLTACEENTRNAEYINFPVDYKVFVTNVKETLVKSTLSDDLFSTDSFSVFQGCIYAVFPIYIHDKHLGTIVATKDSGKFTDDDLLLAEYAATFVGLKIATSIIANATKEAHKVAGIKTAISSLSYSEIKVLNATFKELNGLEGILVASKIAKSFSVSRAIIFNALRKLTSARLIKTETLGSKGTYIRILDPSIVSELSTIISYSNTTLK